MKIDTSSINLERNKLVPGLIDLAAKGLVKMYDTEKNMFCYRMREVEGGKLVLEDVSRRYTIITLMGLRKLEEGVGDPL